jgi:hypothetical protein
VNEPKQVIEPKEACRWNQKVKNKREPGKKSEGLKCCSVDVVAEGNRHHDCTLNQKRRNGSPRKGAVQVQLPLKADHDYSSCQHGRNAVLDQVA